MEEIKLDWQTLAFIKHLFAGRLSNIKGGADMLINGKTNLSSGENVAEIIKRDSEFISLKLTELLNKHSL